MQVFISRKNLSPVRWHDAFSDAVTVSEPVQASKLLQSAAGSSVLWLDFSGLHNPDKHQWLQQCAELTVPKVVLSSTPNDSEAMQVFQQGATGYCHVLAAAAQLKEIALVVGHGGYWLGADFIGKLVSYSVRQLQDTETACAGAVFDELTSREQMVASLVARGATNKEIAASLGVTERTVKAHLSSIFTKSGARDRVHLVLMLHEHEVLSV